MKNLGGIMSKVFKISILIYPITFLIALYCGIVIGIDLGWAMPAMSNHEIMYGWEAIVSYIILIVWRFGIIYGIILIFQLSYIAVRIISKIRNRICN